MGGGSTVGKVGKKVDANVQEGSFPKLALVLSANMIVNEDNVENGRSCCILFSHSVLF